VIRRLFVPGSLARVPSYFEKQSLHTARHGSDRTATDAVVGDKSLLRSKPLNERYRLDFINRERAPLSPMVMQLPRRETKPRASARIGVHMSW